MNPNVKKSKKARKAGAQAKPAIQTQSNPPVKIIIHLGKRSSSWITTSPRSRQHSPLHKKRIIAKETITRPTEMGWKSECEY
jgi:hypothetical protein